MNSLFVEITLALIIAGSIAYLVNLLKQPTILAYILAGLVLGPIGFARISQGGVIQSLSEIGITLLLFTVGLELDFKQFKLLGKPIIIAGITQVLITTLCGFLITTFLGFGTVQALYLGVALTFSSTIIVIKLLNEKKDTQSLYGKIAVGVFIIQDIIAIFLLVLLTSFRQTDMALPLQFAWAGLKLCGIVLFIYINSKYVFPRLLRSLTGSQELLLIFSLGWALGLAALISIPAIGFNLAIGGFLAGLALANTPLHFEITSHVKPIRDFFIMLFFVSLGSQVHLSEIQGIILPVALLSAFVLIGNPIIVLITLTCLGFKPRTALFTGVTVGQISEFSLILITLGLSLSHVGQTEVAIVTLVGIITITLSSYLILHTDFIYKKIKPFIEWLDMGSHKAENQLRNADHKNHIILVGAHRLGHHIVDTLVKLKVNFIIVDFDPSVISKYDQQGIFGICGDITDTYIQELANLHRAKLVISTLPDIKDTLALTEAIKSSGSKAKLIVTARDEKEAVHLYEQEANYVVLPYFLGAHHLQNILVKISKNSSGLRILKQDHLKTLTNLIVQSERNNI